MGRLLLIISYLFPVLFMITTYRRGGGLTELKIVVWLFIVFVLIPGAYVVLHAKIAKLMKLRSNISALFLFASLLVFEITGYLVWLYHEPTVALSPDIKTMNLIAIKISYYLFVSLIYYLVKKDDNIIPAGDSK